MITYGGGTAVISLVFVLELQELGLSPYLPKNKIKK